MTDTDGFPKAEGGRFALQAEDLDNWFTYHPPGGNQPERYSRIREAVKEVASLIYNLCPGSRERSLAFTKLREASMWANAAIACNEEVVPVGDTAMMTRIDRAFETVNGLVARLHAAKATGTPDDFNVAASEFNAILGLSEGDPGYIPPMPPKHPVDPPADGGGGE